jgi:hypothetical protein
MVRVEFDIRNSLVFDSSTCKLEIFIDPRVELIESGGEYINNVINKHNFDNIDHRLLISLNDRICGVIEWLYKRDECSENLSIYDSPMWDHDCGLCRYIATVDLHDLYCCNKGVLIARYNSSPGGYIIGSCYKDIESKEFLWKAAVLAEHRGFGKFLNKLHVVRIIR